MLKRVCYCILTGQIINELKLDEVVIRRIILAVNCYLYIDLLATSFLQSINNYIYIIAYLRHFHSHSIMAQELWYS